MKKFASILTAIVYLVLSTGVIFNAHFCHGELERVSLGADKSFCCCESDESAASCCKDEQIFIHLDNEEQLQAKNSINFNRYDYVEFEKPIVNEYLSFYAEKQQYYIADQPPPPKQPIWKINNSFLFYG